MKRKERKILLRIVNAISAMVFILSCVYLFIWGFSYSAVVGGVLALCCVSVPAAFAGEGALDIFLSVCEAMLHAVVDAIVGVFEAIGNALSGIG